MLLHLFWLSHNINYVGEVLTVVNKIYLLFCKIKLFCVNAFSVIHVSYDRYIMDPYIPM